MPLHKFVVHKTGFQLEVPLAESSEPAAARTLSGISIGLAIARPAQSAFGVRTYTGTATIVPALPACFTNGNYSDYKQESNA